MNIFVVKSLLRHLTIGTVFRGVLAFNVGADRACSRSSSPSLSSRRFLPRLMK